jgi:hypothetical protein
MGLAPRDQGDVGPAHGLPLPLHGGGLRRFTAAWLLAAAVARPAPLAAQAEGAPRYTAAGLDCARFEETSQSEILTQTARRSGKGSAGRSGIWVFRARDTAGAIAIEAWYDSLAVWRRTEAGLLEPDTDGIIGGRFRGRLSPTGGYDPEVQPFVPDEVAEVADLSTALDDLLPPLPLSPLTPGAAWRRPALEITRLPDTTVAGRGLLRFALRGRRETRETTPRGDTVVVPLSQTATETGTVLWDPAIGLVARQREIVVEASIPAGGRVRVPVRSRVVQHVTLTRLPAESGPCR